jgi:O-antigen/teichoic acid export membrane protein
LVDIVFGVVSLRTLSKFVVGETKSDYRLAQEVKFLSGQALLISSGLLIIQFKDPLNLLLMDYWGNVDSVGGYSVMKRLLGSAVFLAVAVSQLGLPMLTRAWDTGLNVFVGQLRTLLQASIILALPVTIGFAFHGDNVLTLLGLYPKFIYGPIAMAVSAPMVLLLYIAMLLTNAIVACGKQSQLAKGSIQVTVVAPLSSVVFIYVAHRLSSNASLGAIFGDIFIEVLLICVYYRILDVKVISKLFVRTIAKAVLLCIPLAFAGMLPNGVFWVVATVVALGLYAGALYKMGLLHKRMLEAGE